QPSAALLELLQAAPTCRGRWVFPRQRFPSTAVAQHPEDAFHHGSIRDRLRSAMRRRFRFGQMRREELPLPVRQLRIANIDHALLGHRQHLLASEVFYPTRASAATYV